MQMFSILMFNLYLTHYILRTTESLDRDLSSHIHTFSFAIRILGTYCEWLCYLAVKYL